MAEYNRRTSVNAYRRDIYSIFGLLHSSWGTMSVSSTTQRSYWIFTCFIKKYIYQKVTGENYQLSNVLLTNVCKSIYFRLSFVPSEKICKYLLESNLNQLSISLYKNQTRDDSCMSKTHQTQFYFLFRNHYRSHNQSLKSYFFIWGLCFWDKINKDCTN